MRTDNRSLVLATLGGLCTAMACTLITDVDRQKIKPPPSGEGGQGASGGSAGRGGVGGKGGKGGASGMSGKGGAEAGGTSGTGGKGGTAGVGGSAGTSQGGQAGDEGEGGAAGMDMGGAGGEAGAPAVCGNGVVETGESCDDGNSVACGTCSADCNVARVIPTGSDGSITIGAGTNIADGDTITLNDGSDTAVLEFECDPIGDCPTATNGVGAGNIEVIFNASNFDGLNDEEEYRDLLIAAIDGSGLTVDASDGGTNVVTLDGVVTLSETVGAPTFVAGARCRADRGCSGDSVCLSNDCVAAVCQ
jgi:cysteine-rich repeat protein